MRGEIWREVEKYIRDAIKLAEIVLEMEFPNTNELANLAGKIRHGDLVIALLSQAQGDK